MKREFKWDFKESMTQEEISAVLEQHTAFLGVDKIEGYKEEIKNLKATNAELNTSLETANAELAPFKEQLRKDKYSNLLPKNANKDLMEDIIALSRLTDEMDEDTIKKAFSETIKNREYLQVKISTTETPKVETNSIFNGESVQQQPQQTIKSEIFD